MNRKNRFNEESFAYRHFYPVISVKRSRPGRQTLSPEIPVRTCPHCGYKIQTWSGGDISCTRCENDIWKGETRSLRELSGEMGLPAEKL
jgi:hypothetical protein